MAVAETVEITSSSVSADIFGPIMGAAGKFLAR